MTFWWPKRLYIKRYYHDYDDKALGRALQLDRATVTLVRRRMRLERDETDRDRSAGGDAPPFNGQIPVPRIVHPLQRNGYALGIATAMIAFVVYLSTLPPTVTGEDSGELVAAAYTLGIPHPPGYPAWCLLTHPFTYLPFGTIAWRVALSSAVFGAGAVFLTALITLKLTGSRIGATAAALLFSFSKDAWEQFVITEVYALNALFIAACIFLLLVWYESRRNSALLWFAFLYGLSLANHSTMRLLGPAFLLFVSFVDPVPWKRCKLYLSCLGLSLLGLSVFLYLPIRSLTNPPVDWGNPETWGNFWAVVRQEQFSFLLTQNQRSLASFFDQLGMFVAYFTAAFTPALVALPLLGLYPLWRTNRVGFWSVAGLALLLSLGMVLVLNYGTDRIAAVVNNVFFIPFHMVAAILAGAGVAWVAELRIRRLILRPLALVLAAIASILPLALNYRANDKSNYYFAYDYGKNILDTLEPNAIYLPSADHATFPVLYFQAVEGLRPDVSIGNKYGYPEEEFYADMAEEIRGSFQRIPSDAEQRLIEEWIVSRTDRPVYFTEKRAFPPQMSVTMKDAGLAYRVVKSAEGWTPKKDYWSEYSWHTLDSDRSEADFTAELVVSDYYFARGRERLPADIDAALEDFESSAKASGLATEALNNIGTALAEHGRLEKAAEYYLRSVEVDTNYKTGLRNLGQVYMALQKHKAALLVLDRLRRLDPNDLPARYLYASCLKVLGRIRDSESELLDIAAFQPNDPRVHRELGLLYIQQLGDPGRARQHLAHSLALEPDQPELRRLLNESGDMAPPPIPGLPNVNQLTDPLSRVPGLPPR